MREGISKRGDAVVLTLVGVALRIAFWGWTERVWEDALITVAHARNAIEGLGLTHHGGEPATHGFTSALSVLIPVIGEALVAGSGLDLLRLASLAATVVTVFVADDVGRRLALSRWARILILGYLAVDPTHIFYGMSGMETQVAVAALLVTVQAYLARSRSLGIALGIAILARPDFVLVAVAVGVPLFMRDRPGFRRAAILAGAVVAPWAAFTTAYYGSPIPNTIVAKAIGYATIPSSGSVGDWVAWIARQATDHTPIVVRSFSPFLEDSLAFGAPVPTALPIVFGATMLVAAAWGFWRVRRTHSWHPLAVFLFAYLVYRVLLLPASYFDWYAPPFTAIAAFGLAAALDSLVRRDAVRAAMAVGLVLAIATPLPWVFEMERTIQASVERDVRQRTAIRLGELVPSDEGVISESAGYVGFYSRVTLFDYPGLTSPTALAALRGLPPGERSLQGLIHQMEAPWLVLRPAEFASLLAEYPATAASYEIVDQIGDGRRTVDVGGYSKLTVDDAFMILRRRQ